MITVTYFVPTISCGNCKYTIETVLGELQGVHQVRVALATKQVVVTFDSPATEDTIKALLAKINHPVRKDAEFFPVRSRSCCG